MKSDNKEMFYLALTLVLLVFAVCTFVYASYKFFTNFENPTTTEEYIKVSSNCIKNGGTPVKMFYRNGDPYILQCLNR